jgi:hypothetical protein
MKRKILDGNGNGERHSYTTGYFHSTRGEKDGDPT